MSYQFDVEKIAAECIAWTKNWFAAHASSSAPALVGISGGKDSALVAKILVDALGRERVFGVMMPNGQQADIADSQLVCDTLGIRHCTVDIAAAYEGLTAQIRSALPESNEAAYANYQTNTPARLRMTALYGIAAVLGGGMVANTCNLSEDLMGYSTFYGDSAGSFAPVSKLTTDEIVAMGDYLNLPRHVMHKAPADGMCGRTDEDNLGWTYHEVNQLVREGVEGPHHRQILERWRRNKFKLDIIRLPCYIPDLPVLLDDFAPYLV